MPIYHFKCCECCIEENIVAGIDDGIIICTACAGLMLRQDDDIFGPYFQHHFINDPACPWCVGPTQTGTSKICPRHAEELRAEIEAS